MKKEKKIKLNQLKKVELSEKEMNRLVGGDKCCLCGCWYQNLEGSSSFDNADANYSGGLYSPAGGGGVGEYA